MFIIAINLRPIDPSGVGKDFFTGTHILAGYCSLTVFTDSLVGVSSSDSIPQKKKAAADLMQILWTTMVASGC